MEFAWKDQHTHKYTRASFKQINKLAKQEYNTCTAEIVIRKLLVA